MQQRRVDSGEGRRPGLAGALLINQPQPSTFDAETLAILDRELEVDIETVRQDGEPKRTTIWVVVDDGVVFVRSWLGDRGHWYRHALVRPEVTLHVAGRAVAARAVPATDDDSVERTSRGFQTKYEHSMSTAAMVAPGVLHTTMRLEPR